MVRGHLFFEPTGYACLVAIGHCTAVLTVSGQQHHRAVYTLAWLHMHDLFVFSMCALDSSHWRAPADGLMASRCAASRWQAGG